MRISTFQFYHLNTANMLDKQSSVNDSIIHLSEGKRVLTAGDDAVAANSILNFKQEVRVTDQYQSNIDYANARLSNEETALKSVETLMSNIKDLTLQGNTGALGAEAREAIAQELENNFEQLLSVANTRDEAGNYIFAGFQTAQPPFAAQPDGTVLYGGDQGVRQTTVGNNVSVATNDSGDDLFMAIPNSVGDFRPDYAATNTGKAFVESATIVDPANYDPITMPPDYRIDFVDLDSDGVVEYQIFDSSAPTPVQIEPTTGSTPFSPSQPINFNGVEIVISDEPEVGDSITMQPQDTQDIFTGIQDAINWMRQERDENDEKDRLQTQMGHILSDLDIASNHVTSVRANIGSRMQVVDSQGSINEDYLVTVKSTQSNLEDLDIAEASTALTRQSVALQAAQLSFSKVQSLTLLNYI